MTRSVNIFGRSECAACEWAKNLIVNQPSRDEADQSLQYCCLFVKLGSRIPYLSRKSLDMSNE